MKIVRKYAKWAVLPVCLGLWLIAHLFYIIFDGLNDEPAVADVIVIPGNQVFPNGALSPRLRSRMEKGLELYRQKKGRYLLVSGATGVEGVNEGLAMAAYCKANGVPDSAIIVDTAGANTFLTACFVAKTATPKKWTAIGVSHYYHQTRFRLALQKAGVKVNGMTHCPANLELREPVSLLREWPAFYEYWLLKNWPKPTYRFKAPQ